MKITFIKDHLNYKIGDIAEVTNERGLYLINVRVAIKSVIKVKK